MREGLLRLQGKEGLYYDEARKIMTYDDSVQSPIESNHVNVMQKKNCKDNQELYETYVEEGWVQMG